MSSTTQTKGATVKPSDFSLRLATSDRTDYPTMMIVSDHSGNDVGIVYGTDIHDAMDRFYRMHGISRKG